jgi:hypothetical protein
MNDINENNIDENDINTHELRELQKYILIKRDTRELRQILFGDNDIHGWDKILILYSIILMYQHVYLIHKTMIKVTEHNDFNYNRDFKDLFMFVFFLCNLRTSYLYLIKTTFKVDKKLATNLHSNMGEYFEF